MLQSVAEGMSDSIWCVKPIVPFVRTELEGAAVVLVLLVFFTRNTQVEDVF